MSHWRRLRAALVLLVAVMVIGTCGYVLLGFGVLDALYQTVTTVATVGFREVEPLSSIGKIFTMVLILIGVGATLYAFSVLMETLIEGRLLDVLGRRRMERTLSSMQDHVIICGWGRVGQAIAAEFAATGRSFVVVDVDGVKLDDTPHPAVLGDATDDRVMTEAGLDRCSALVAAVDSDAANAFITLGARALRSDVFIVARVRSIENEEKLRRSGADRVVNPQSIGGTRMAAFVLRPHVAAFLDVVMHERNLEFRLEELAIAASSPIAGLSLSDARVQDRSGALVLAVRQSSGAFLTNPPSDTRIEAGHVLIAIGTAEELSTLAVLVASTNE